jgi:pyridoxine 5-phosphate synthase
MTPFILNLDPVAFLRESRRSSKPDPVAAAVLAQLAGADGVSLGLRTDRRHAQERDVKLLRETAQGCFHLRIPPSPEALQVAAPLRPESVVLTPERSDSLGNENGFDLSVGAGAVLEAAGSLREAGIPTHVLVDPDREQVKAAHRMKLTGVSLCGARLAAARLPDDRDRELEALSDCLRLGRKLGLYVRLAHALGLKDLARIAPLGFDAVELGQAPCALAMMVGMERAVLEFRDALDA